MINSVAEELGYSLSKLAGTDYCTSYYMSVLYVDMYSVIYVNKTKLTIN